MTIQDRRNHITIVKAIGIILMVAGHSCIPSKMINDYIYIFHMPLFFFCSGYFFKEQTNFNNLWHFCYKRIKSLYLPYLKWSFSFLLLHNFFFCLYLYNSPYDLTDFLRNGLKIATMTEFETLLRPFWFLKVLLLSSIFVGLISYLWNKYMQNYHITLLSLFVLVITISIKLINAKIPLIGDPSVITFGTMYILSGFTYRKYERNMHINFSISMVLFCIILIGSNRFHGIIDMRYTTALNTLPYYILSIIGIILVLEISIKLDNMNNNRVSNILYYIGNRTMPILALHLLSLKLGNYVKLILFNLSIDRLNDHTVITDYNEFFWIIYILLGIICPLFAYALFNTIMKKIKIRLRFL